MIIRFRRLCFYCFAYLEALTSFDAWVTPGFVLSGDVNPFLITVLLLLLLLCLLAVVLTVGRVGDDEVAEGGGGGALTVVPKECLICVGRCDNISLDFILAVT